MELTLKKEAGESQLAGTVTRPYSAVHHMQTEYIMSTEALLGRFCKNRSIFPGTGSGLIPTGLRYLDMAKGVIVFEKPPAIKTIRLRYRLRQPSCSIDVPIPWTVYIVQSNRAGSITLLNMFFRNSQLRGLNSRLGSPWMPNVYADGSVCRSSETLGELAETGIGAIISLAYKSIWEASFNSDILPNKSLATALSTRYSDSYPDSFMVTNEITNPRSKIANVRKFFPTYGFPLEHVINQFYPYTAYAGTRGSEKPETLEDNDGDPCFSPYITLGGFLKLNIYNDFGSSKPNEQLIAAFSHYIHQATNTTMRPV